MNKLEITWVHRAGTDSHGERFSIDNLLHASGRILAKVFGPVVPSEYAYRVSFYATVPKSVIADQNEAFDFMDADSARAFAETILDQFDPFSPPRVAGDNTSECTSTTKPVAAGADPAAA